MSKTDEIEAEIYTPEFIVYAKKIIRDGFNDDVTTEEAFERTKKINKKITRIFVDFGESAGACFGALYLCLLVEYEICKAKDEETKK